MLKYVDGVVGNSSSGIIESPLFQKFSLNIGSRQDGREKTRYTIDCGISEAQIERGLKNLFGKPKKVIKSKIKYESPSKLIVNKLKEKLFGKLEKNKSFHDLKT